MKNIRHYLGRIVEETVYVVMTMPLLVVGIISPNYTVKRSGFADAYNEAVVRNADLHADGKIIFMEELETRRALREECAKLSKEGAKLEEIVSFLRNK